MYITVLDHELQQYVTAVNVVFFLFCSVNIMADNTRAHTYLAVCLE